MSEEELSNAIPVGNNIYDILSEKPTKTMKVPVKTAPKKATKRK